MRETAQRALLWRRDKCTQPEGRVGFNSLTAIEFRQAASVDQVGKFRLGKNSERNSCGHDGGVEIADSAQLNVRLKVSVDSSEQRGEVFATRLFSSPADFEKCNCDHPHQIRRKGGRIDQQAGN